MFSKREAEGYVLIDCRNSPGLTEEESRAVYPHAIPVRAGKIFEGVTMKCSHCDVHVMMRVDRTRARGYCPKCDHFVCDACEALRVMTGVCNPSQKRFDDVFEQIVKATA